MDEEWAYSFEAERISCSKRQITHASRACKGITSDIVGALTTALPHVPKEPSCVVEYIQELGCHANSRHVFNALFSATEDKVACIKDVSPQIYLGTREGIRSGFCAPQATQDTGQCIPCEVLEQHSKLYSLRAKSKTASDMLATHALRIGDSSSLATIYPPKAPLQNLTGMEWRQRAALYTTNQRADKKKATRAAQSIQSLKAQVQDKLVNGGDEMPELLQLFTTVTETGVSC